jgi:acetyl esterase/lipase
MKQAVAAIALCAALAACAPSAPFAPFATTPPAPDARFAVTDTKDYGPEMVDAVPSDPPTLKVAYGTASARQFGELRVPKGKGPFPIAVIYHGGCWKTGIASQAYMAPLATRWQSLGIATLNVDYREVGDGGGWPGSFTDWAASAKLIEDAAKRYPIDRARMTLVGHSAGALPAQWLASAQGKDGPIGARKPLKARAAIVLDGPGDVGAEQPAFDALCQFSAVDPFMGAAPAAAPDRYAAISPVTTRGASMLTT